LKIMLKF